MFFPKEEEAWAYIDALFRHASSNMLIDPTANERSTLQEINQALGEEDAFRRLHQEALKFSAWSPAKSSESRWMHGGLITAYLLLIPLVVQVRHGRTVGRRAAFRVLTAWLSRRNGMLGAKERTLQQIWQRYQSVAHLWATYHIFKTFPKTSEDLMYFLSCAESLRYRAEAYRAERSREPLLDSRVTWKVAPEMQLPTMTWDLADIKLPEKWMHKAIENDAD